MDRVIAFDPALSRFKPLKQIYCFDDFDRGSKGWVDLTPNFRLENFEPRRAGIDLTRWGPCMLSSATFSRVGTHGSFDGIYSLKLATRPTAAPYQDAPRPGSMSQAIKRLSIPSGPQLLQVEMWFAYKPEQDRTGLGEKDVRAFGFLWDIQDAEYRFMPTVRYLNSVNGELTQRWQYAYTPAAVTPEQWELGNKGWCLPGIDSQWWGRRYPDGRTDGFQWVPEGKQKLCYNESDDKINWLYFRFLFNLKKREYVELQSGDRTFDLRGLKPTLAPAYANITGLLNPSLWVEADTDRRVFLYVDSVLISVE